jgi:bifunctional non-homologous end joining protein LigD
MAAAKRAKPRARKQAAPKPAVIAKPTAKSKSAPRSATKHAQPKLSEYRGKRDFSKTAEPAGGTATHTGTLRFVVQKHAARQVHFDLRLELDGVMKSWAVPKGPSQDPSVKRLAMQVEDHPIEYNTFEGTIPQGEYGGGTVMLWDRGTYIADPAMSKGAIDEQATDKKSEEAAVQGGYDRGDLKVVLHGERMQGSWVLVRTRGFGPGRSSKPDAKPSWLLIKHRDAFAHPGTDIVADAITSVESGRTMDEITAAADKTQ